MLCSVYACLVYVLCVSVSHFLAIAIGIPFFFSFFLCTRDDTATESGAHVSKMCLKFARNWKKKWWRYREQFFDNSILHLSHKFHFQWKNAVMWQIQSESNRSIRIIGQIFCICTHTNVQLTLNTTKKFPNIRFDFHAPKHRIHSMSRFCLLLLLLLNQKKQQQQQRDSWKCRTKSNPEWYRFMNQKYMCMCTNCVCVYACECISLLLQQIFFSDKTYNFRVSVSKLCFHYNFFLSHSEIQLHSKWL